MIVKSVEESQISVMMKYRPNVAALMLKPCGLLLICERATVSGAWQFPQGGVDPGEAPEDALLREVQEEIGLGKNDYRVTGQRGGYRYSYPLAAQEKKRKKHGYEGQEQTYYTCLLTNAAAVINVQQKPQEFRAYRWIWPDEFDLTWLPSFKQEVYRQVLWDFFEVKA